MTTEFDWQLRADFLKSAAERLEARAEDLMKEAAQYRRQANRAAGIAACRKQDGVGPEAEIMERCAKIAENPGFIQGQDSDWDIGVNYAKRYIAQAIRKAAAEARS